MILLCRPLAPVIISAEWRNYNRHLRGVVASIAVARIADATSKLDTNVTVTVGRTVDLDNINVARINIVAARVDGLHPLLPVVGTPNTTVVALPLERRQMNFPLVKDEHVERGVSVRDKRSQ